MEFTDNQQHQPFKRISRLGVVTLLHIALLAVVLNDMKIKIALPKNDPFVMVKTTEPEPQKLDPPKKIEIDLPKPLDPPPYFPKVETDIKQAPKESPIANTVNDPRDFKGSFDKGGTNGGDPAGNHEALSQTKAPVHVAAVIDVNACDKPTYPASSIRNGETGTVTLSMLVGTDGRVVETRTDNSSGYRALDRAASQALSLCRFKPGTIDGVPQQSWTKVQYVWKMD